MDIKILKMKYAYFPDLTPTATSTELRTGHFANGSTLWMPYAIVIWPISIAYLPLALYYARGDLREQAHMVSFRGTYSWIGEMDMHHKMPQISVYTFRLWSTRSQLHEKKEQGPDQRSGNASLRKRNVSYPVRTEPLRQMDIYEPPPAFESLPCPGEETHRCRPTSPP